LSNDEKKEICLRVLVKGKVQGVGFRWFIQNIALSLNLNGYVRNLPSGNVEFVAQGKPEDIDTLLEKARKGSSFSRVLEVVTEEKNISSAYKGFDITY